MDFEMKQYSTEAEIKEVSRIVGQILAANEEARNDDKVLISEYLARFGIHIPKDVLRRMPPFETIRRERQHYQAEGKYPPTNPEVIMQRQGREKFFRQHYKKPV